MKAPAFWWTPRREWPARLLSPAAAVVGRIAARRMASPPTAHAGVPVICVGNPTVGGAGKTPVALAIADALAARGHRPVFLTRGYRGRLRGPVQVMPSHTARDVGDEPLLLAERFATVVAADRAAGGTLAAGLGDVIIMDDGFQNPALHKDCALLVIDAVVGLGNGAVTPAGPLRAPFAAHLPHADAIVRVTGAEPAAAELPPVALPVFTVALEAQAPVPLEGIPVLAFAGIGRPEKFYASVAALGAEIRVRRAFGDHAHLRDADAGALLSAAEAAGLLPVTTRKDLKRLAAGGPEARRLAAAAIALDVRAELPEGLVDLVAKAAGAPGAAFRAGE